MYSTVLIYMIGIGRYAEQKTLWGLFNLLLILNKNFTLKFKELEKSRNPKNYQKVKEKEKI